MSICNIRRKFVAILAESDNFKFVTKVFAMKGIKIELLGSAIIPLGIAVTTNNFLGYVLGVLGFVIRQFTPSG